MMMQSRTVVGVSTLLLLLATSACNRHTSGGRAETSAAGAPSAASASGAHGGKTAFDTAFEDLCYGGRSFALHTLAGQHYVELTVPTAHGVPSRALKFHLSTAGNSAGLLVMSDVLEELGYESVDDLPRGVDFAGRALVLEPRTRWQVYPNDGSELDLDAEQYATEKNFFDGQIGAGFLSQYTLCVDPKRGRIGLGEPGEVAPVRGVEVLPMITQRYGRSRASYGHVYAMIDGRPHGLVVSNGAGVSVLESTPMHRLASQRADWPLVRGPAGDADVVAGAHRERMLLARDIVGSFPPRAIDALGLDRQPRVDFGEVLFVEGEDNGLGETFGIIPFIEQPVGVLGNDVWRRFRYVLDYKHDRMYLEALASDSDVYERMQRVGLSLGYDREGCPVIRQIASSAAPSVAQKLAVGDVILEVEGSNACEMWRHELNELLRGAPGDEKRLLVRRDLEPIIVSVPVTNLLRAN